MNRRAFSSLRVRILAVVLVAVVPIVAAMAYSAMREQRRATEETERHLFRLVEAAAIEHRNFIAQAQHFLAGLALLPSVRALDGPTCSAQMARIDASNDAYRWVGAATPDGRVFCSSRPMTGVVTIADRRYFREAVRTGGFVVGDYTVGKVTQERVLPMAYPVTDLLLPRPGPPPGGGGLRAVLVLSVDFGRRDDAVVHARPPGSRLTIIDRHGTVLDRRPRDLDVVGKRLPEAPLLRAVLRQHHGVAEAVGLDGIPRVSAFAPLPGPTGTADAFVVLGVPRNEIVAPIRARLLMNVAAAGGVTLLALAAALVLGEVYVLRPAKRLIAATEEIAGGRFEARTGVDTAGEVGALARAFDRMAETLGGKHAEMLAATERLRKTSQTLAAIIDTTPLAIWAVDGDGAVTSWNPAAERVLGWRGDEVLGQPSPIGPDADLAASRGSPSRPHAIELRLQTKAGTAIDGAAWFATLPEGRGTLVIAADISDRKRGERAFAQATRALRVLSQSNSVLVRAVDESHLLQDICRTIVVGGEYQFAWIGLVSPEDPRTVTPVAHAGHDDGYFDVFASTWATDHAGQDALEALLRDGTPLVINDLARDPLMSTRRVEAIRRGFASLVALRLSAGGRALGVLVVYAAEPDAFSAEEITLLVQLADDLEFGMTTLRTRVEYARAQDEVEQRRIAAHQSEKLAAMGQLLAGVAHELNNPLAVVQGRAQLLLRAADGPLQRPLEQIATAAERCSRIVRNFLALARQYPPERQEADLNRAVRDAIEILVYPLRVDSVHVTLDLADDLPPLWSDPHQLHQVVVNLVSNAHDAMRAVPVRRLTIRTRCRTTRDWVSLEVADSGSGIPADVEQRIFEPFFTTKPPGQGTGLGLSLCRGIVESHGGSIRLAHPPGGGAAFIVDLPVLPNPHADRAVEPQMASAKARAATVLVVDDEPDIAGLLAEMLGADGHQVETAANGRIALEKLRKHPYDLVLTDIRMPELDGPGLYRHLEREDPALARRVVFVTGDVLTAETKAFLEALGAPIVEKPFTMGSVAAAVSRALRRTEDPDTPDRAG